MTALLVALALASEPGPPGPVTVRELATVLRTHDADTITVQLVDPRAEAPAVLRPIVVRLLGVDGPEYGRQGFTAQPGASRAAAFTRRMLLGKTVELVSDPGAGDHDRYGRSLRWVEVDGQLAQVALLVSGMARAYMVRQLDAPPVDLCALEAQARKEKVGIWRLKHNAKPSQCPRGGTHAKR